MVEKFELAEAVRVGDDRLVLKEHVAGFQDDRPVNAAPVTVVVIEVAVPICVPRAATCVADDNAKAKIAHAQRCAMIIFAISRQ